MRRIGILGGTFNPIHKGHLHLARELKKRLSLDKVIFVPCYMPPHKKKMHGVKSEDRMKMVKIALKGQKDFEASGYETGKKRKSYTVNTLKFFKKKFGGKTSLFFLAGSDEISGLKDWKELDRVLELSSFVVASRPGFLVKKTARAVSFVEIQPLNVSSTEIRRRIKKGMPITALVPRGVASYIREKGLYSIS